MKYPEKGVIYNNQEIVKVDRNTIEILKYMAEKSPNKRARICLHRNTQEPLHEMVIILCRDCYIRPHKHVSKSESFHIIEGGLRLFFFDDNGKVIEYFDMGDGDNYFLYRAAPDIWHTPVPTSKFVVFHETTNGPFIKKKSSLFPNWAPDETNKTEIRQYLKKLMNISKKENEEK